MNIENIILQIVYFDNQQLPKNNINNHEMNNISKPIKEQKHENHVRKKLLREYITS